MTIRAKVIALLVALFAALGVAQLLVQQRILLPSFAALERSAAIKDMDRVVYALRRELDLLGITAHDWGNWSDTYAFMRNRDSHYVQANLTDEALSALRVSMLAFVDPEGRYVWSVGRDSASHRPLAIDFLASGALPVGHPWRVAARDGRKVSGFLQTNQGVVAAVLMPILNGFEQGPPRGMVLMGRLITAEELRRIGEQAQVKLSRETVFPREYWAAGGSDALLERDGVTYVTRAFNGVDGSPALALRIAVPRTITERGRQAVSYASTFLLIGGGAVLLGILALLHRTVLSPLGRMTRHAIAIGHSDDLTSRISLERDDELGLLAREFDKMLGSLQSARRKLADRAFDAGIAENASGVLHNLGNAMTPLAVRIATLQRALREAPTSDVDLILTELSSAASDPSRKSDLEELLRLTTLDLAQSVAGALADADVVARHAHTIERLLADQNGQARREQLVDTVLLPELIDQSAELVAPALRNRLTIHIDASVGTIGPVSVPRFTLQQIFQNLIVNAAEAVRPVAAGRGTLQIAAELTATPSGSRLHVLFTDDGVGIHAEHLPRVFDRGFSTKPLSANSGIGLHWCSNAVIALGGLLTAQSAGPDGGAIFHLTLPLGQAARLPMSHAA